MFSYRFLYVVPAALVLSACALFQPIYQKTAVNDADDCIATESKVISSSATAIEAAVGFVMRRCDVEVHAAEVALLTQTRGDGRSDAAKANELRQSQRDLARKLISLARAI